ncbi:MAG: hypothetical protein GF341_01820 [candidate division Zixibacteria bacterium]|nr:hypothetical protein [candidate division Zixibacteria bacterium]
MVVPNWRYWNWLDSKLTAHPPYALVFGWIASATGGDLRLAVLSVLVFFVVGGGVLIGVRVNR